MEPLNAVGFVFINPAVVCLRNRVTSRRVLPGSDCAAGHLFLRGKIKSNCLVLFRALNAAHLCHSKSHLDANSSSQVEGFHPSPPHTVCLETGAFAAEGRCDKGRCVDSLY